MPADPAWSPDGRSILIKVGEQGNANLVRVDAGTGQVTPLTKGRQEIVGYTADTAAAHLAVVRSTATVIGDLEVVTAASGVSKKLTGFNDALAAQLTMTEPEEFWYTSFDGKKIQGWIQKPPDFTAGRMYPCILEIHGGPHSAYGNTFTQEFQWMAAKGYVVLYTNPRGSSNYGQDFGNSIQFAYPGDDYKDLMAGVDEVVKRGYVDPARHGRNGRQRWRAAHELGRHPDHPLQSRGQPAGHRRLEQFLVHGGLHALHADLVPQGTVRGSRRLREALADHLRRSDPHADAVRARRRGLPHAHRPPAARICSAP